MILLPLIFLIFDIQNGSIIYGVDSYNPNFNQTNNAVSLINLKQIDIKQIPTAESVYNNQSFSVPSFVNTFVWYIVDEAHESLDKDAHKHISDHNPVYLPTNLILRQGTAITFLDADAKWDSPRPHTINILDESGNLVSTTEKLDYTNSSKPIELPMGNYLIEDSKYDWMRGHLSVLPTEVQSSNSSNLIMGGFYTPTKQVADPTDNDGGIHPGWLGYYKTQFPANNFDILSYFDFHYAVCNYCPGGYWPDQKTDNHTLLIYATNQVLTDALDKLAKFVWDNPYT